MTGTLTIRKTSSGKEYYYIRLRFKDPSTNEWKDKIIKTGLEVKNNKKRAQALISEAAKKYSYLENPEYSPAASIDPDITLCDYLDHWLAEKKISLRAPTYESYESQVGRIKTFFEKMNPRVTEITPCIVDKFLKYMLANGKINQKTREPDGPLSVKTVRSYKNLLNGVFTQARIDGLITSNPVDGIIVRGQKNSTSDNDYLFLTEDEIKELMDFVAKDYPELLGIVFFGIYYGLRRSEILGLKWDAIDFDKKLIHIRHTIVRNRTIFAADCTKTDGSKRDLSLFPTAEKCLQKIFARQTEDKAFYKNSYLNTEGYVFCWEDGRLYDPDYITKRFRKAMRRFGRPEITLHKLRHTCASILIDKGWDAKKVQYWLGHEDIKTTLDIYAHYVRSKSNQEGNVMEALSSEVSGLFD